MIKKYILGNWKMHGLSAAASALASEIATFTPPAGVEVAIFPPATTLGIAAERIKNSRIALGAQDCSPKKEGAFTGDISAIMLKDAGCRYVIVGHSERRTGHGETNDLVKSKAAAALEAGLVPVICVGENQTERESGKYLEIIKTQVRESLPVLEHSDRYIIAYEPVWAIGSGKTPLPEEISQVHKTIASLLSYGTSGARTAVVYGGSVKAAGAKAILSADGVDGVLVGGASLNADEFEKIIESAKS